MTRLKILVVDDESAIRELLTEILVKENYEVVSAANGKKALELCAQHAFSLILTDERMPGGGANELISGMRHIYQQPVPVILMTGHDNFSDEKLSPFARVFLKPFPPRELVTAINSILKAT